MSQHDNFLPAEFNPLNGASDDLEKLKIQMGMLAGKTPQQIIRERAKEASQQAMLDFTFPPQPTAYDLYQDQKKGLTQEFKKQIDSAEAKAAAAKERIEQARAEEERKNALVEAECTAEALRIAEKLPSNHPRRKVADKMLKKDPDPKKDEAVATDARSWLFVKNLQESCKTFAKKAEGVRSTASSSVTSVTDTIADGIFDIGTPIITQISTWKLQLNESLKPVSDFTGSTLGVLSQVPTNPFGFPSFLVSTAARGLSAFSPKMARDLEKAYKSRAVQVVGEMPTLAYGSLKSIAFAADAVLSIPLTIAADVYNGLKEIIEEIANLIDDVMASALDFIFGPQGLLDSILPITEVLNLLSAISNFSGQLQLISNTFNGITALDKVTQQINTFTNTVRDTIDTPKKFVQGAIDQALEPLSVLRNPDALLQSLVPVDVLKSVNDFKRLGGYGLIGNTGLGIGDTLNSVKDGVFTKALTNFEKQAPFLNPLFGKPVPTERPRETARNGYMDGYFMSPITGRAISSSGNAAVRYTGDQKVITADSNNETPNT